MTTHKKAILTDLVIKEISGVDSPAQEGSVVKLMKRNDESDNILIGPSGALTTVSNGHTHLIFLKDGYNAGETSKQDSHTHPWVKHEGGVFVIGVIRGANGNIHNHELFALSKGIDKMPNETSKAKDGMPNSDDLKVKLKRADAIIKLNQKERGAFDNLDSVEKQNEFLGMSGSTRALKMDQLSKAAHDLDPIVYTTSDGQDLRKSIGNTLIRMAKANDDLLKRLNASEAVVAQKHLEDRVSIEIPHLPGTVSERAALLKAIDTLPDEKSRLGASNALRAQNSTMAKAFLTQGVVSTPEGHKSSPSVKLEAMAKALVTKDPQLSIESAYVQVMETRDGQRLYAATVV